ncbi:ABC transporter permease [Streptomyces sp. MBT56]|uniref:ABC transporter permease n=1 Tax=unclassified Streptomyces TaxID=2593676 RepID=UPI00190DEB5E|nr:MULTISPECIES: ABC transporter permease [unclassified Streptomyces]MBK3560510.1 ABC transporter permease [Streptomyces sp. MBT56]MBK3600174.1 ABC transporter permease [Streptomyces sp. MBT54]MBK3619411.1 ABC transporter permease [Streptomyces sp. MBT98]
MLMLALRGIRLRWVTFVGSFVALVLGVGLIAATGLALAATFDAPERGPERFAAAPVVVRADALLRVDTPTGTRTAPLDRPGPVPPGLAAQLASLGRTVEDRSFPADIMNPHPGEGADARVGHPWSVAAAAPYRLATGRAPAAPGEVVVTTGSGGHRLRTGDRVRVRTPAGSEARTVVGTVAGRGFEDAVFLTDDEAARISPDIDALVVHADATAVRDALGPDSGMDVLTGHDRRRADPDPDRDAQALVSVNALLGTAAGITLFVSAAVVASTFSYAVAQRRREFGLLRTAGATPGQIRRTVLAESVLVGVAASAAGAVLGAQGAPLLVRRMTEAGLAPPWFALGDPSWPLHTAFWTGVSVATAAALVSCHRAGRTAPTEALREAAVDSRVMPVSRWAAAVLVLLIGLGLPALALAADPGDLLGRKSYVTRPMVLIVGCALLAPVLVRPVGRLLTWLPARLPGATGVLVRENTATGVRRTAAVAAPVLITVALAASLTGTVATLEEARATEARTATTADFVVTPGQEGRPLAPAFLERVRNIDGAVVSASRSTAVTVLEENTALVSSEARAVDPARLAAVAKLPVAAGRLADLDDDAIVVNEEWLTTRVGDRVTVWLGDGSERSLRIAAVLATGTGDNGVYVTPRNAGGADVDRIDVEVAPGGDRHAVAAALDTAAADTGTRVATRVEWLAPTAPGPDDHTRTGLRMILGIALLSTATALANTLVMATSGRRRDLAVLRLAGATAPQVLRLVVAEALAAVGVGAVLGGVVAAVNLLVVWGALALLGVTSAVVVPWAMLGLVVAAAALLAAGSAVLPALSALRTRPVELAGSRE